MVRGVPSFVAPPTPDLTKCAAILTEMMVALPVFKTSVRNALFHHVNPPRSVSAHPTCWPSYPTTGQQRSGLSMSLPRHSYDPRRACLLPLPPLPRWVRSNKRSFGIYLSGALFSLGWWIFFDALLISSVRSKRPPDADDPSRTPPWLEPAVTVSFADWLPGLLATLGMIVVNLIDKSILAEAGGFGGAMGGGFGGGGDPIQWRARLFLFVGFALLAGGLAGSVTVLTIKYIIAQLPEGYEYYGFANVVRRPVHPCLSRLLTSFS